MLLQDKYASYAQGYSFVSPSVMLSNNNVIANEYVESQGSHWDIQKFGEQNNSPFFQKYTLDLSPDGFLGHGAFSVVRCVCVLPLQRTLTSHCSKCSRKDNGQEYAVKIVAKRHIIQGKHDCKV